MKFPKKTKQLKESEHAIQTAILHYLGYKGFYTIRLNSGMIPIISKGRSRLIRMAERGTPDIMAFRKFNQKINGIPLTLPLPDLFFFEVKVPGNKPTFLQEAKMKELEEYGAKCYVVHSVKEVEQII